MVRGSTGWYEMVQNCAEWYMVLHSRSGGQLGSLG